jgi:ketosteroid isomerase-like protein
VRAAETAFAKSMADRNLAAFTALLADEAVFFGGKGVMRGKAAVAADWKRFFDGAAAPFSWAPAEVEVLPSGNLGFTSGPSVRLPAFAKATADLAKARVHRASDGGQPDRRM